MNNPASAYVNTSFESAPPLKILRMLYAGALKFLDQARALELPADNIKYNDLLGRADAIVSELRCSLDASQSEELSAQLDSLYVYVSNQIGEAFLDRKIESIDNAHQVLKSLKSAWDQLEVGTDDTQAA